MAIIADTGGVLVLFYSKPPEAPSDGGKLIRIPLNHFIYSCE